jgi:hypothetical protein
MAFEAEGKFTTKGNSPHNNSLGVPILIQHNNLTILHINMHHPNQSKTQIISDKLVKFILSFVEVFIKD